jgi:hypothetical protein
MSAFTHAMTMSKPYARSVAVAALMTSTMLGSPTIPAHAAIATLQMAESSAAQIPAGRGATEGKGETVEQRITALRSALGITPGQELLWNGVAQAMRENAAAIDKLIAENRVRPVKDQTAVADLTVYQKFAQAHLDGLQNLISSFDTLYDTMPASQKKIADEVFMNSAPKGGRSHG